MNRFDNLVLEKGEVGGHEEVKSSKDPAMHEPMQELSSTEGKSANSKSKGGIDFFFKKKLSTLLKLWTSAKRRIRRGQRRLI